MGYSTAPSTAEAEGQGLRQYVSTRGERRAVTAMAVGSSLLYFGAVTLAGPTSKGRLLEPALMAVAALVACGLTAYFFGRLDPVVRPMWAAYATGVGLYAVVFVLQLLRELGCVSCGSAGAVVALTAFGAFGLLLGSGLRLAYGQADRRLWIIEVLDASAVSVATGFWVAILVELDVLPLRGPLLRVEAVEVLALPLLAAGLVFALRAVSTEIAHYKLLQSVFLLGVGSWFVARGLLEQWGTGTAWTLFALSRAVVVASAIAIPAFGVAEGRSLRILDVEGPHERRVADISAVVGALAVLVVLTRIYVDPESVAYRISLPALGAVSLLMVLRLAATSEYHRHLESAVTESARRYREIVEGAHHGVLEVDGRGIVRYCNEAAGEIVGCGRDRLIGSKLDELLTPVPTPRGPLSETTGGLSDEQSNSPPGGEQGEHHLDLGLSASLRAGDRVIAQCEVDRPDRRSCYVELAPLAGSGQGSIKTILRDVTLEVERRMRVESLITALRAKAAERAALMREMLEAGESERASIASQLHDGPLQHLTLLALKTDLLRRKLLQGQTDTTDSACQAVLEEVRAEADALSRLSEVLNPRVGSDMDLERSLEDFLRGIFRSVPSEAVGGSTGGRVPGRRPPVRVTVSEKLSCSSTAKIALYRSLQAIALDARVSGASWVEVELSASNGSVRARVRTDAPLDNPRARGVARARTWTLRFGGNFQERKSGSTYEAELRLPQALEAIPREAV